VITSLQYGPTFVTQATSIHGDHERLDGIGGLCALSGAHNYFAVVGDGLQGKNLERLKNRK
jgi:hypothetical protein